MARLSGDEFVVILLDDLSSSIAEAKEVITVVEKIVGSLAEPYQMPFGTYSKLL